MSHTTNDKTNDTNNSAMYAYVGIYINKKETQNSVNEVVAVSKTVSSKEAFDILKQVVTKQEVPRKLQFKDKQSLVNEKKL